METFRNGTFNFTMMVAVYIIGTAIIIIPVLGVSEQDMWISGIIGWVAGIGYAVFLSFCKQPEGRYTVARIVLSLYSLHLAALVTRNMGEIIHLTILPNTPQIVCSTILVLLAAYATAQGIEVIWHLAFSFLAIYFVAGIILIGMAVPEMNLKHVQPMLDHGLGLIAKEAVPFISFPFMETVVFLPLLRLVKNPLKSLLGGVFIGGALLVLAIFLTVLVLPPNRIQYIFSPILVVANSIPGENFAKAGLVLMWVQTGFLKLAVLHFIVVKQLGDALAIDYKKIILPLSILIINFSILVYNNFLEMFNFAFEIYPYYAMPLQIAIPLYFIIVQWLSKRKTPAKS
ncbi:MAG: hypothetical protein VR68_16160 [Peptococcaceae bacterium BRH_c4a]|nr:MAG: hypothetical protein VR68_16160 [Peptococcaceae bacterium BRH_c4a]